MSVARKEVTFQTVDGLTLRGWLYPAVDSGPAVIITPGVSLVRFEAEKNAGSSQRQLLCVKESMLPRSVRYK